MGVPTHPPSNALLHQLGVLQLSDSLPRDSISSQRRRTRPHPPFRHLLPEVTACASDEPATEQKSPRPLPQVRFIHCRGSQNSGKPSSSKDRIKDTDGQPDEEIHRERSGRVPRAGAAVPVDVGCVTLLAWEYSPAWKLFEPHTFGTSWSLHHKGTVHH